MNYILISLLIITLNMNSCNSQTIYKEILASSAAEPNWVGYIDKDTIHYRSGKAWGVVTKVEIDAVKWNSIDSFFSIVGQLVTSHVGNGRTGFCCFNIFLAEVKGDSLIGINRVGTTNDRDENPIKESGYFEIKISPTKFQRLFFASPYGAGLHEFSLEKLVAQTKKKTFL